MKKKFLSVLALSMCCCMSVSTFAGCSMDGFMNMIMGGDNSTSGDNSTQTSENNFGTFDENLPQDEMYAEIMKAVEATEQYKGAVTVTYTSYDQQVRNQEDNTEFERLYRTESVTSIDPATQRRYRKTMSSEHASSWDYESVDKMFKQGNQCYSYDKSTNHKDGTVKESYYTIEELALKGGLRQNMITNTIQDICDEMTDIPSLDALNVAYAEVIADTKAMVATEAPEEMQYDIGCDVNFSCMAENGSYVFVRTTETTIAYNNQEQKEQKVIKELRVAAKNGFISEATGRYEVIQNCYETADRETVTTQAFVNHENKAVFEYTFAQEAYDATVTTIPDNVTKQNLIYNYDYVKAVEINGMRIEDKEWFKGNSFEEVVEELLDGSYNGLQIVWYTDKACTKPFTADITEDEFKALDTLYGKATSVGEGYGAVVWGIEEDVFADDVNDNYRMAFSNLEKVTSMPPNYIYENNENRTYTISKGSYDAVYVNGVEVVFAEGETTKVITLAEGEFCLVKYVNSYEKKDLSILGKGLGVDLWL